MGEWDAIARGLGAEPCEGNCGKKVYRSLFKDDPDSLWEAPRGNNESRRHTPQRCRDLKTPV